ncbi:unnamed protein product [Cyprideis torosa]|uniref:Uncharacterized protein n=1 Tax=Cyprideis torosa TaxID=163714 RepID=A0A7R8WZG8_9CRUS|nr:unnamed protein product [Cyprideis torosa]CAG0910284.1 unnamed protein product [Cyprideis torosa]
MQVIDTPIAGLKVIEPRVFGDERGYFMETWNHRKLSDFGIEADFVQDNESQSSQGTLRGIHFQKDHPQDKLVRVLQGEVYDVAVDLRLDSPTYGQAFGEILSAANKRQLWIPKGFGHAYYTISETAIFVYKCTEYYFPDDQFSLDWSDPALNIQWPLVADCEVLLSKNDKEGKSLQEITILLKGDAQL